MLTIPRLSCLRVTISCGHPSALIFPWNGGFFAKASMGNSGCCVARPVRFGATPAPQPRKRLKLQQGTVLRQRGLSLLHLTRSYVPPPFRSLPYLPATPWGEECHSLGPVPHATVVGARTRRRRWFGFRRFGSSHPRGLDQRRGGVRPR